MRPGLFATMLVSVLGIAALVAILTGAAGVVKPMRHDPVATNVDVSQRHTNESEEAVAVNPTNPQNIVIVTNVDFPAAGMFEAVSFDGGSTWTTTLIGNNDNLGAA